MTQKERIEALERKILELEYRLWRLHPAAQQHRDLGRTPRMKYLALAALVCVPIAAAAGYVAHRDPGPPPFGEYVADTLAAKHVPGQDTDDWLAVATTGPNKGGAMDVFQALATYPTHEALEQSAQGRVEYYELKCSNYSTSGKLIYSAARVVRSCTSEKRTRKQAEDYMTSLIAPEQKS